MGLPMNPILWKKLIGGESVLSLITALSDTSRPAPSFIEGWALNSWHGVSYSSPSTAGIPIDSMSNTLLEYTVSGVTGAATLTIVSGDQTKGAGQWGAVVQHDDGSYGAYTISSLGSGTCTVFPNIRSTITSKNLCNFGGSDLGQHFSEQGYKSLARMVYGTTRSSAYRTKYAAKWDSSSGLSSDWTSVGGLGGQFSASSINPFTLDAASRSNKSFVARGRRVLQIQPSVSPAGKGLSKTFALGGSSGFLEAYVSCARGAWATAPNGFYPFRALVVVDGVTLLDKTYSENDGLQRIIVPYSNGISGTVTFTMTDPTVIFPGGINIGDVTWWSYDRVPSGYSWSDSVIDKNAKTVVIGDSWTTFYPGTPGGSDGAFGRELQAAMTAAGGTGVVKSVGLGGATAENYGLPNFDALVATENPAQVLICFFTNDHNQYGDSGYERWLMSMFRIGRKCQSIGARPIYVMPMPTQSGGQSVGHGIWADELGAGLPIA